MDLRQLACVVSVARFQSFTAAADHLFMSQPTVSVQVRRLESELGVELFERTSRRVSTTPAGTTLVVWAERMLADADAARRAISQHVTGRNGRLRVAGWCSVNPEIPQLLADFSRRHPGIEVRVVEENSDRMLDLLRNHQLDVALPMMRDGLDLTGLDTLKYLEEPFVLMSEPGSALARRDSVDSDDLGSAPLIMFRPGSSVRLLVERFFERVGIAPRVVIETAQLASARSFVSAGMGVAILPRSVAERPGPSVAIAQIVDPPMRVSFLAWRSEEGCEPATGPFVDFARSRLRQLYGR